MKRKERMLKKSLPPMKRKETNQEKVRENKQTNVLKIQQTTIFHLQSWVEVWTIFEKSKGDKIYMRK